MKLLWGKIMTSTDCKPTAELLKDGKAQKRGSITLRAETLTNESKQIGLNMPVTVLS